MTAIAARVKHPRRVPSRPRAHQLEDRSIVAFQAALPEPWVFRRLQPDYGLDGHVEIFDADGQATGAMFFVQVKATDEADLDAALAVRLRVEHLTYYAAVDLPVLLVRFYAPSERLFSGWVHRLQLGAGLHDRATTTLRLSQVDVWGSETPEALAEEVEAFRQLRSAALATPVPIGTSRTNETTLGHSVASLVVSVRSVVRLRIEEALALVPRHQPALGTITFEDESITATAGRLAAITVRPSASPSTAASLACDALVGIALAFARIGHRALAARILLAVLVDSSLLGQPDVVMQAAAAVVAAHRTGDLIKLASDAADRGKRDAVEVLHGVVLLSGTTLSDADENNLEQLLKDELVRAEAATDSLEIARAQYNLANHLRSRARPTEALGSYEAASTHDPSYSSRGYYHRERAGVLFALHRYDEAAAGYHLAIALGEERETTALYADSLFYAGSYRQALEQFERVLSENPNPSGEWVIKATILNWLCEVQGVERQGRRQDGAESLAAPHTTAPPSEIISAMESAIALDALCGVAWLNLAMAKSALGVPLSDLVEPVLLGAATLEEDAGAWADAVLAVLSDRDFAKLFPAIVSTAHRFCGQAFLDALVAAAHAQSGEFPEAALMQAVDEVLALEREKRWPAELRWLLRPGEVVGLRSQ